ncbi:MAG: hypothetical protein PVH88_24895 [Ignavibacteria bacterium]|jgi:hypothetical protein
MPQIKPPFITLILFAVLFANLIYSQSDYEKTQKFNLKYKEIEQSIINAQLLDDCAGIETIILYFKNEFIDDKELLDKTLYPLNFEQSIVKLEELLETRKNDFSKISTLQDKINSLDRQNSTLLNLIEDLENSQSKDAEKIDSLNRLTSRLKSNIKKRDKLVENIVDSLLNNYLKDTFTLNSAEKVSLRKYVEYNNLFYNVKQTISDNIRFLNATRLQTEDFAQLKIDYKEFEATWNKIGPRLAEIYLNNKDKTESIAGINEKFSELNETLNNKIWRALYKTFKRKEINLQPFGNGEEFTTSALAFIDDEIKNIGIRKESDVEETYEIFVDSLWFNEIKPNWIPFLTENKMFTREQKDTIEFRFANWNESLLEEETDINYLNYIIVVVVIIIIAVLVVVMFKKKE